MMNYYYEEEMDTREEIEDYDNNFEVNMMQLKLLQREEISKQRLLHELQTSELKELYLQQRSELKIMLGEQKLKLVKLLQETFELEEEDWIDNELTLKRLKKYCKLRICYLEERIYDHEARLVDLEEKERVHREQTLELERLHAKELCDLQDIRWKEDQALELKRLYQVELYNLQERRWMHTQQTFE